MARDGAIYINVISLILIAALLGVVVYLQNDVRALRSEIQELRETSSGLPAKEFTLETTFSDGFAFLGKGGAIDGVKNPTLKVKVGDVVKITIVNGDGVGHDFVIDELKVHADHVKEKGESVDVIFKTEQPGEYTYYCSVPGHREAGMEGKIIVVEEDQH
ncbi:MAG: cupredoxin domain-containing protein [Aigarchaeota archaeon]|nr:cupredoxin domain-containing protein [Candidatus Pelearchaeum maunauluense]